MNFESTWDFKLNLSHDQSQSINLIDTFKKAFIHSRPSVMKLFTTEIYCHYMVLLAFCAIKQYYHSNYHRIEINYHSIVF
jgi:hypothetical protein